MWNSSEHQNESHQQIITRTRCVYCEYIDDRYQKINNSSNRSQNFNQPRSNNNTSFIYRNYKQLYQKKIFKYKFNQTSRDNKKKRNKNKRSSYHKKNNNKKNNNKTIQNSINLLFPLEDNNNYNYYQPSSYVIPSNYNATFIQPTSQYNAGPPYIITNDINQYNNYPNYIQSIDCTGINNDYSKEIHFINNDLNTMYPPNNQIYSVYQSLPDFQQQNVNYQQINDIFGSNSLENKNNNLLSVQLNKKNNITKNKSDYNDNNNDNEDNNDDDNEDENDDDNNDE